MCFTFAWSCLSSSMALIWLQVMREGTDVTLLAFGKLVGYNMKVAEDLEKEGISCEVCLLPLLPRQAALQSHHSRCTPGQLLDLC